MNFFSLDNQEFSREGLGFIDDLEILSKQNNEISAFYNQLLADEPDEPNDEPIYDELANRS